jgi:hypothetical protein
MPAVTDVSGGFPRSRFFPALDIVFMVLPKFTESVFVGHVEIKPVQPDFFNKPPGF